MEGYASDAGFPNNLKIQKEAQESMAFGASLLTQGDASSALTHISRSLQLYPTADAHYNMGICQYMLKDTDKALDHWHKSLSLDPNQADVYVSLGNIYFMSKKDPQQAISYMTKAQQLAPEDPEIMFNLACMQESSGSLEPAIQLYEKAIEHGLEKAKAYLRNAIVKQMAQSSK
ncbi:hypothetical protein IWW40_004885 [Coemansia sp. RSA 1250]|nr:hypothetical protein IWW40_004885 [Coemansia sp. RSA 1250]